MYTGVQRNEFGMKLSKTRVLQEFNKKNGHHKSFL